MRVALTMGDPAGVGPEICLKLLHRTDLFAGVNFVFFGDRALLERVSRVTELPFPEEGIASGRIELRQIDSLTDAGGLESGKVAAACGRASYDYLEAAIHAAQGGDVDAIVTAPINKEALHEAGITYPGHTEILAALTQSPKACMLQYSQEVTASFVTCHCGYADVPRLLTRERLREVIDLTHEAVSRIKRRAAHLVVLGLNPHAGEHGLFGDGEEEKVIVPEIEAARERDIAIRGLVPPDTAFLPKMRRETDAFVCMYHDQGHIPLKALAFDSAVNVTLGLPIVRTSVDHGTAFDIAWTGQADPGSMLAAVRLAMELVPSTAQ